MGHKKFDQYAHGKYWKKYFNNEKEFYNAIKEHILKFISKENTFGFDIGAGPGIGAHIFISLGFSTKLIGFEPSETHFDGKKLSAKLINNQSSVKYIPKHLGINNIKQHDESTLDYILILRASHEIAESLGGKNEFFAEIFGILGNLNKSGVLIIADHQYAEENIPEKTIQMVQKYQMTHLGHCHIPSDYISSEKMKKEIEKCGLKLINETTLPHTKLLKYLNSNGLNLDRSPCSFYVQTFCKMTNSDAATIQSNVTT